MADDGMTMNWWKEDGHHRSQWPTENPRHWG